MSQQNNEIEEQYIISTKKYIVLSLLSYLNDEFETLYHMPRRFTGNIIWLQG